jgi:hypothetical protein
MCLYHQPERHEDHSEVKKLLHLLDLYKSLWSVQTLAGLSSEKSPGTHWIGGWVSLRACLDAVEKRKLSWSAFEYVRNSSCMP